MELPTQKIKKEYLENINALSAELQSSVDTNSLATHAPIIQRKLDAFAAKYENNEAIGKLRYKLYELQALLHYFQGQDDKAIEFIEYAITVYGESYPKADRLISQLQAQARGSRNLDKEQQKYFGIKGWLMFYAVGLVITIILMIIGLLTSVNDFNELATIKDELPEIYQRFNDAMWTEIILIVLATGMAVATLVQIMKHNSSAKTMAIVYMAFLLIVSFIDYGMISSIASDHSDIDLESAVSEGATSFGRNFIYAAIWIPYFLVSKRVKTTLIK